MSILETIPQQFDTFNLEECYEVGSDGNIYILDRGDRVTLDRIPGYILEDEIAMEGLGAINDLYREDRLDINIAAAFHGTVRHLEETIANLKQIQVQETPGEQPRPLLEAARIFGIESDWRLKNPNKPLSPDNTELIYEEQFAGRRDFQESQVEKYHKLSKLLVPFEHGEHELTIARKRVLATNYICRNIYSDESLPVEERARIATIAGLIYPFARQPQMIGCFGRGLNMLDKLGHLDKNKNNLVVFHSGRLHATIADFIPKWLDNVSIKVHYTQHAEFEGRLRGVLKNSDDVAQIIHQGYATKEQIKSLEHYHLSNIVGDQIS